MRNAGERLQREFFERPTATVAVDLISCVLWRYTTAGVTSGRIVETEAYLDASDRASHAAWSKRGQDVMKRAPGTIYIYRSYGMHWMLNIVAHVPNAVGAVLIRALQPLSGIELMEARRKTNVERQLCSGPGKLCQAMGVNDALHKVDLTVSDAIWITAGDERPPITIGERIGITKSPELQLRFFEQGNQFVSAHRKGVPYSPEMLPST